MKLINKKTDYAIRAVLHIALQGKGKYVSSAEIAKAQKIPLGFLRILLQKLIKEGILSAREGKNGGVSLKKKPEQISVKDLITLFQGRLELSDCMFRRKICPNRTACVLRPQILEVEEKVKKEFSGITIGKLVRSMKKSRSKNGGKR